MRQAEALSANDLVVSEVGGEFYPRIPYERDYHLRVCSKTNRNPTTGHTTIQHFSSGSTIQHTFSIRILWSILFAFNPCRKTVHVPSKFLGAFQRVSKFHGFWGSEFDLHLLFCGIYIQGIWTSQTPDPTGILWKKASMSMFVCLPLEVNPHFWNRGSFWMMINEKPLVVGVGRNPGLPEPPGNAGNSTSQKKPKIRQTRRSRSMVVLTFNPILLGFV